MPYIMFEIFRVVSGETLIHLMQFVFDLDTLGCVNSVIDGRVDDTALTAQLSENRHT